MATKVRSNFSESNYLSTAASKATTDKRPVWKHHFLVVKTNTSKSQ